MCSRDTLLQVKEHLTVFQNQLQCAICLDMLYDAVSTQCGHSFCPPCISKAIESLKSAPCPLCQSRVTRRGIKPNEKIQNIVKGFQKILLGISQDTGIDVMQLTNAPKDSTREAFSPTAKKCSASGTSGPSETIPKPDEKVNSWLQEMSAPTISQQSTHPSSLECLESEDSDSEMVSVSQVKPEFLHNITTSATHKECNLKSTERKTITNEMASASTKDNGNLKSSVVKRLNLSSKWESTPKNLTSNKTNKGISKIPASTSRKNYVSIECSEVISQDSVDAPVGREKENSINTLTTRSPGWSRYKKMKSEFHEPPKIVLRTKNAEGVASPIPAIEEDGSGVEEPCVSLTQSSPCMKIKECVNMIVHNLEAEIEFETRKGPSVDQPESRTTIVHPLPKPPAPLNFEGILRFPDNPPLTSKPKDNPGKIHQLVEFLKLGSLLPSGFSKTLFFLKGPLEHVPLKNNNTVYNSRVTNSNALTQWSPQTNHVETQSNLEKLTLPPPTTIPILRTEPKVCETDRRRSEGAVSNTSTDFMDAETVLVSQLASSRTLNQTTAAQPCIESPLNETVCNERGDLSVCGDDIRSQPEVMMFSGDEEEILTKDPEDSSSSDIIERKTPKRVRTISDSNSSTDSDDGFSKVMSNSKRKKKTQILSDSESSQATLRDLHISPLRGSLAATNIEATIKAKIEADLKKLESKRTVAPYKPEQINTNGVKPVSPKSQSDVFDEPSCVESQRSIIHVDDSDGDSDFIHGTPVNLFYSRDATQSDDVVPNSQPHFENKTVAAHCSSKELNKSNVPEENLKQIGPLTAESFFSNSNNCLEDSVECSSRKDSRKNSPVQSTSGGSTTHSDNLNASIDKKQPQKLSFICSNLPAPCVTEVQNLARIVGAEFFSKLNKDLTHLVVSVNAENAADKTLKYMFAVAGGKWVVSYQWVLDSLKAKKMLPEEPYEALDSSGEPGPRLSRNAHQKGQKLFSNFEFYCLGDFPDLSKVQMEELLIECGAVTVQDPFKFSFSDGVIALSLSVWDDEREEEFSKWLEKYSSPLIQHDWVLDCIGKYSLSSLYTVILCDIPDNLCSMGYPSYLVDPVDSVQ